MADRVAVMSRGHIEQVSSPIEIYDRPRTLFVNQFVGSTNVLYGELVRDGSNKRVVLAGGGEIDAPAISGLAGKVAVAIRPEHLHIAPGGKLAGIVKAVMPLGAHVVYDVELATGISLKVSAPRADGIAMRQAGEQVCLAPTSMEACHVFPAHESQQESQQGVRP